MSLVAGLALGRVWQGWAGYVGLCYPLGWWWVGIGSGIGIGIGIYAAFGRSDNLLLDSLKGLALIVLTWRC